MAKILAYPDERLRQVSRAVAVHDAPTMDHVRVLCMTLRETMYDSKGWGLSAVQIGAPARVFVVHVPHETSSALVFVNAEIQSMSVETCSLNEGCLSFGGIREPIVRPARVTLRYWNERGHYVPPIEFDGWTARAIIHEMEHLDGKLLIDQLLPAARRMLDRSLTRKQAKVAAKVRKVRVLEGA